MADNQFKKIKNRYHLLGGSFDIENRGVRALTSASINLLSRARGNKGASEIVIVEYGKEPSENIGNNQAQKAERTYERFLLRFSSNPFLVNNVFVLCAIALTVKFFAGKKGITWLCRMNRVLSELGRSGNSFSVAGGDSFSDIYGIRQFLYVSLPQLLVLALGHRLCQLPQTFGPYRSRYSHALAGYILRNSSVILARDKKSLNIASRMAGKNGRVFLCPDMAFSLKTIIPDRINLFPSPALEKGGNPLDVIGININGLMFNGGYTKNNMFGLEMDYRQFAVELVEKLLNTYPGEIWLIPHTFAPDGDVESDPEACRQVRDALAPNMIVRVRVVQENYDQFEIKGVIGKCNFFIGSRMHSCIAALSQGIPCVGVAYSRKFEGVFESVGMEDWVINGRTSDNIQAIERVLALYEARDNIRESLRDQVRKAQGLLNRVFEEILNDSTEQSTRRTKMAMTISSDATTSKH